MFEVLLRVMLPKTLGPLYHHFYLLRNLVPGVEFRKKNLLATSYFTTISYFVLRKLGSEKLNSSLNKSVSDSEYIYHSSDFIKNQTKKPNRKGSKIVWLQ